MIRVSWCLMMLDHFAAAFTVCLRVTRRLSVAMLKAQGR